MWVVNVGDEVVAERREVRGGDGSGRRHFWCGNEVFSRGIVMCGVKRFERKLNRNAEFIGANA